jgi:two-component system nitrogen regulation response regulator GlnG
MSRILIIDDEPAIGWSLREMLSDEGHAVEVAASVEAGLETCARFAPEAMLLDVRLPGRDGLSALPELRSIVPEAPVVVMTAFGDLETAVRAVNAGAFDYLVKPFDLESVSRIVAQALAERAQRAPTGADRPAATLADRGLLVGSSPPMQEVFKQISLVAPTDLPVLITGETGTGKDLAARAIHAHGPRRDRPFVAASLGALAPSVIESELFGHVRGAFTGATADRPGLFAMADGGTLFLDEIGEAPIDLQVKLLRALETREVTPVGAATPRTLDVRVIAATNRDLAAAIAAGTFREDLYHRLHVFPIHMPPLAARGDDIETLAGHLLARHAAGRPEQTMSAGFLAAIRDRPWPGNVRGLKHAIEYAAVVARGGTLRPEHLPPATAASPQPPTTPAKQADQANPADNDAAASSVADAIRGWVDAALADGDAAGPLHERLIQLVETTLAEKVVDAAGGNRTAAAKLLGLDRATLRSKLNR